MRLPTSGRRWFREAAAPGHGCGERGRGTSARGCARAPAPKRARVQLTAGQQLREFGSCRISSVRAYLTHRGRPWIQNRKLLVALKIISQWRRGSMPSGALKRSPGVTHLALASVGWGRSGPLLAIRASGLRAGLRSCRAAGPGSCRRRSIGRRVWRGASPRRGRRGSPRG